MEKDNRNAYSEVIEILKFLDDEKKLESLPMEMLELLKSKSNPEYKPQISKEIPLEEQKLEPETLSILSWIAMKYWKDEISKEENDTINTEYEVTPKEEQEQSTNTYQKDLESTNQSEEIKNNIQENSIQPEQKNNNNEEVDDSNKVDNNLPVLYKNLKWYQKIKVKIIEFFNRILNRKKFNEINNKEEGKV